MSIAGNLKTMDLAELLQWLSQSQKTGTLVIDNGQMEKRLFLKEGRIVSSASTDPKEYLGHFLVSQGLITDDQLERAVQRQSSQKMLLGKILLSDGAVTEKDLQRLLRLKAEESIFDIFTWENGDFRFLQDELPDRNFVPLSLDLTGILMEGARRVDEWRRIREVIPHPNTIPVSVMDLEDPSLHAGVQRILALVDDQRSVEEIQEQTHSTAFFVCSVLFDQYKSGKIKLVKPRIVRVEVPVQGASPPAGRSQPGPAPASAPPPAGGWTQPPSPATSYSGQAAAAPPAALKDGDPSQLEPSALLAAASENIARRDFERAMRYLRAARNVRPDDPNLQSSVKAAEQQIRNTIEQGGLALNKVPKLAVSMDQLTTLNVSAQEGFILTRIDGTYDLKSILKISPMPEIDALILFDRLLRAGHIRV